MTNELTIRSGPPLAARPSPVRGMWSGMAGAFGSIVMVIALAVATAVAVVFAATLAVILALATLLTALSALAWRVRPTPRRALAPARAVGHAWVTYGWERSAR